MCVQCNAIHRNKQFIIEKGEYSIYGKRVKQRQKPRKDQINKTKKGKGSSDDAVESKMSNTRLHILGK